MKVKFGYDLEIWGVFVAACSSNMEVKTVSITIYFACFYAIISIIKKK